MLNSKELWLNFESELGRKNWASPVWLISINTQVYGRFSTNWKSERKSCIQSLYYRLYKNQLNVIFFLKKRLRKHPTLFIFPFLGIFHGKITSRLRKICLSHKFCMMKVLNTVQSVLQEFMGLTINNFLSIKFFFHKNSLKKGKKCFS